MVQVIHAAAPVLAAVTELSDYVEARARADLWSFSNGLPVADMPMAIQALTAHPEVRGAIRPCGIDTLTGEYHGQRDGSRSYEVWHSVGSLATADGLAEGLKKKSLIFGKQGFMDVENDEWVAVGNGRYNGQNVVRVHLEEVKRGNVPAPGTPYSIFVRLDRDSTKISGGGLLVYDAFMRDDRVLMVAGSLESREALANMLFRGEGHDSVGSIHDIGVVSFDAMARGRLTALGYENSGLVGNTATFNRRFAMVDVGRRIAQNL